MEDLRAGMEEDFVGVLGWWLRGRQNEVEEVDLQRSVHEGADV